MTRIVFHIDTRNNIMHNTHVFTASHDTLQRLFRYKAWANDALLNVLAKLSDDSPVTNLAIKALSHTYVVDRIFAAHLRRKAHAYASANMSNLPTLENLSADIRRSDLEYVEYVATLPHDHLAERIEFRFTDGKPGCMSREEILMHVITHGTGHRGQVSAVMLLNSQLPATDGFTTYLHTVEASTRVSSGPKPAITHSICTAATP
jgi:uncharacterized damage-inducible protein DinB